jgi:hypothetical protein
MVHDSGRCAPQQGVTAGVIETVSADPPSPALNPYNCNIFSTFIWPHAGLAPTEIHTSSGAMTYRVRLKMNSLKMILSSFAVAVLLGTPALAKPPVHHDHPERPPVLSTFNGVSPPGGRIGPDSDPSIRAELVRDVPEAGSN